MRYLTADMLCPPTHSSLREAWLIDRAAFRASLARRQLAMTDDEITDLLHRLPADKHEGIHWIHQSGSLQHEERSDTLAFGIFGLLGAPLLVMSGLSGFSELPGAWFVVLTVFVAGAASVLGILGAVFIWAHVKVAQMTLSKRARRHVARALQSHALAPTGQG